MKAKWILLSVVVLAMALPVGAQTDPQSSEAIAHVYVNVVPNIAVGVITSNVDLGNVRSGVFEGLLTFRVDANVEQVSLAVVASNLYKGDVPTAGDGSQIPVSGGGILVRPDLANPTQGAPSLLPWSVMQDTDGDGWNYNSTISQPYESSQPGHFSQDVDVTVTYNQIDPELPMGEYSGWVKLVAMIDEV